MIVDFALTARHTVTVEMSIDELNALQALCDMSRYLGHNLLAGSGTFMDVPLEHVETMRRQIFELWHQAKVLNVDGRPAQKFPTGSRISYDPMPTVIGDTEGDKA